jgi:transposase
VTKRRNVKPEKLAAALERAKASLNVEDYELFKETADTLVFLTAELERKGASIQRLRHMLFGASTEKTSQVVGSQAEKDARKAARDLSRNDDGRGKRKGHGRNGASAYTGAARVKVPHPSLHHGDSCPECQQGKVYIQKEPSLLVRITGVAPLSGKVFECDELRCNLCGEVFTAPAPEGVGEEKYDETATSMIGLVKYGAGLPFNRTEKLQAGMGIPLPASTQWDLVRDGAENLAPAHKEMVRQAAQGEVLYNDDTTMKVLELTGEQRAAALADEADDERTGVFTSGIVSTRDGHKIALFFTGVQHAGENLADVLKRRAAELPKPIQMCDALPTNTAGDFETILASCISHARRKYVDVAGSFPDEVRFVLETLRDVYKADAIARKRALSLEERLTFHQSESGPLMEKLERWMKEQFDERKVEPNSTLGEAILYMQKHWSKLTLFLRMPGAPLDNNICERALKKTILHRKNALFYKTLNGAKVGDIFMSLIHTAELNRVAPFDYLVALLRHPAEADASPADWMPWNYQETLARTAPAATPG